MTGPHVKLGLMPPLTGLVGIYGSEIVHAAQIACQQINENGGVLGRTLELVVEDDGSLPESAVAAAEKLVDYHRCTAIIGNLLSNSRIAVAYRVAEPRRIPLLNFSFYEGSIASRYFFHFAALPNQQIDQMIPHMRNAFGPTMYFAGNNYEWPRGSIHAAKRALLGAGGEVVGEEYCPIGVDAKTIEDLLDHVSEADPDVFVPYFAGTDQVHLLTSFTERGLKKRMAVVMGHYDEMMASKLSPEVREGFYSSNTYFMTVDTAENHAYLERLGSLPDVHGVWPHGNGILTNFGEGTYVCVKAFAEAANRAGSLVAESLVDALSSVSVQSPQGSVRQDPEIHHATVNTFLSRCRSDGQFEIVERFGAIDPVLPDHYNHQRIGHQATLEEDIRLQSRILEQMSEAVVLVDSGSGRIVYANAGAARMFGYDRDDLARLPISRLIDPSEGDPQITFGAIAIILSQKGVWQGEIRSLKRDGTPIWCAATVSTFTHPVYGEVWLAVQSDISTQKSVEAELAEHRDHLEDMVAKRTEELEAANQELEAFSYSVSHDLRAPLRAIEGFTQALEEDSGSQFDDTALDHLARVRRATATMSHLIDDLLSLSRLTKSEMRLQEFDLSGIASSVVDELRSADPERTVDVHVEPGILVNADPTLMRSVLSNLIGNAWKFSSCTETPAITFARDEHDPAIMFVRDNGAGFDMQYVDRLFGVFRRLPNASDIPGTGVGLATVRRILHRHDGRIWAEAQPGKGATFYFTVGGPERPRAAGREQAIETPRKAHQFVRP